MVNTKNLAAAAVFMVASLGTLQLTTAQSDQTADGLRPNIVWIMSEDNSVHYLDHFFQGGADTPAIKQLASDGVTFTRAYSCAPVCSVARTTLITSCYAPRLGTQYHRRSEMIELPNDMKMFPEYLRAAGYYTTNNSKEDYNATGNKQAWNNSSKKASWRNRPTSQTPFFHVQTFTDSHESSLHFDQKTFQQTKTAHDPELVTLPPYLPDTSLVRYTHARYLDRMQQIDQRVADVVDQLKADGVWDNTIVFYFGDHGGVLPRSKGYAYDTGLHVPLVIRIPERYRSEWNLEAGSRDDRYVEFVDFGPTVLSMAGVNAPKEIDGDPFLGNTVASNENFTTALGYADRFDEKYDLVRSLHRGKFHYIRNYQPFYPDALYNEYRYNMLAYQQWRDLNQSGELNLKQAAFFQPRPVEMLFDLEADPFEVNNLAGNPQYSQQLSEMREELRERLKQLPDLSFLTEPVCVPEAANSPITFAHAQQDRIGKLLDIADTCLTNSDADQELLTSAIQSSDPLERFWAATSLASYAGGNGKEIPEAFVDKARTLLKDENVMVRARAAEAFLVLAGNDPMETLLTCLSDSQSELQALWILNAIVFVNDSYPTERPRDLSKVESPLKGGEINRRLKYLTPKRNP